MKRSLFASAIVASLAAVACSGAAPSSDPTTTDQAGLTLCPKSACGPQLGIPNYLCPDGKTIAGPTGLCIEDLNAKSCHWQIVSCPQGGGGGAADAGEGCACPNGEKTCPIPCENGTTGQCVAGKPECSDSGVGVGDAGEACACPNGEKTCSIPCENGATGQCVDGLPECPQI